MRDYFLLGGWSPLDEMKSLGILVDIFGWGNTWRFGEVACWEGRVWGGEEVSRI